MECHVQYKCVNMYTTLKLLEVQFYIMYTLLNDGYSKYVYNNRYSSSFHRSFNEKIGTTFVNKTNDIKRYRAISPYVKFRP